MRRLVLLLAILLTLPGVDTVAAEKVQDYAVGSKEVLSHLPELPATAKTGATLKEILARPEFQVQQTQQGPSLFDRILNWLMAHLPRAIPGLAGAGKAAVVVAALVIAALLVLLIYVVVRAIWGRMSESVIDPDSVDEERLDATGFRELADRAAASGDFRAALRYRFKSVVGGLGVLDSERRTNWQLLRHVRRDHSSATNDFAELVSLFEDCWYGGRLASAEDYARFTHLARSIELKLTPREEAA